ncbi:Leucine-rich repeat-containing protein 28 [Orchesella cincta]|uniref:Leucine-rich repeat-containing protein 28 n=1 Tax=Orchesella cincta TaxID=48709 RepID=A0A1D2N904_ORCCI|nr:Leucine-rich repeat-containing protein 28 [Orchesella cincta]
MDLEQNSVGLDYELIQDILGRMILHWNYRNLKEIPPEVLNYGEHIEEIYLKRNCLEKLPANIGKLCNLTNLYLVGNQLEELPNEIGDLKCLRVLDVSQNYIKRLPDRIGELHLLESVLLTYNQLEELPKCLRNLHRLKQLEVSGNRIYSIPKEIVQGLESLEEFGIDRNPINSIPRNICQLQNLRYFSACRCNLLLLPSLPFHTLMHNRSASSSRSHSSGAGGCNRNLQFLFDGNPRLNYIPYWVFQLLGTSVECFGCGLEPGESDSGSGTNPLHPHAHSSQQTQLQLYTYHNDVNRPKIKLNFKGKRRTLHFDEDLVKLHHCGFNEEMEGTVIVGNVSLLELCLRQVHSLGMLEKAVKVKKCGAKPVVEPLIVPQRAGDSLINIRGDLHRIKEIVHGHSVPTSTSNTAALTSSVDGKTAGKSEERLDDIKGPSQSPPDECDDGKDCSIQKGRNDHIIHVSTIPEMRSATEKETKTNQNETNNDAYCSESHEDLLSLMLPLHLSNILKAGPVAKCFECLKPIFIESWPIVFRIPGWIFDENDRDRMRQRGNQNDDAIRGDWDDTEDGKLSIGSVHFCSPSCISRFRRTTKFTSNLLMNDLRCIVENEIPWTVC